MQPVFQVVSAAAGMAPTVVQVLETTGVKVVPAALAQRYAQCQDQVASLLSSLPGPTHQALQLRLLAVVKLLLAAKDALCPVRMAAAAAAAARGRGAAARVPAAVLGRAVHRSARTGRQHQLLQVCGHPAGLAAHHQHASHSLERGQAEIPSLAAADTACQGPLMHPAALPMKRRWPLQHQLQAQRTRAPAAAATAAAASVAAAASHVAAAQAVRCL